MSNRNRTSGHSWELRIIKLLKELGSFFSDVASARSCNRQRDGEKVDIVNQNEFKNGRLGWNIQAKSYSKRLNYDEVLDEMPKESGAINVIFHRFTKKKGTRFYEQGCYAICKMEDFLELIKVKEEANEKSKISTS